ncbi:MAG: phosphoenolpyruvate carboxykinase (ATP) [Bacilli bacterium]|jgi:Phosphoenolpyruvate carboxykinase (ATP)|nr:phosphoenolpyruvate carboxykinase (ATP) [Bacilli bacterium]
MATKNNLPMSEIGAHNKKVFSRIRTTIESAFYRNNVVEVTSLAQAYELAKNSSGTIVTDQPIVNPEKFGLPKDAKVLLYNDGKVTGRQAKLRRLVDETNVEEYAGYVREVVFASRNKKMYHAMAYVGLDKKFMLKAHLLVPEGYENTLYSWILNFQTVNEEYTKMYHDSLVLDEGDIYIYSDPDMYTDRFPEGLALFDQAHNCAMICGMRYFGEHKKGTLTLAWSIAERNGYTACHGGQKRFNFKDGSSTVIGVFGLSGSGKSTITLSDHGGKLDTTVLHDDAFIISNKDCSSISLEQSYFDKTQDYPLDNPQSKYFLTIQNCGATRNNEGKLVPVTEDICNGNGRTVKSVLATGNREYAFNTPVDAIFWIMKDKSLPPVVKVNDPALASVMGATLATMRSTAEQVSADELNKLVFVPYANPFRLYELHKDYEHFKQLFEEKHVDCYIINTGFFLDTKVTPKVTLGLIEEIVQHQAKFVPFGPFTQLEYLPLEGYEVNFGDKEYLELVKNQMASRLDYVNSLKGTREELPTDAVEAIKKVTTEC